MAVSDRLTESLVIKLMEVMKTNPYACFFRSLRNIPQLDSYQIVLKSHTDNDQRVFNQPTASQIAALWVEGENSTNVYSRHIQIYTKEGHTHRIQYYYGCYDPLQYPLLFPLGETGWHPGIKRSEKINPKKTKRATRKQHTSATLSNFSSAQEMIDKEGQAIQECNNSKEYISMREYYAYKMQIRHQCTPNILNTGRLFQQFVVEMYVKIETQRLDFYRSRQQLIRREQLQRLMDSIIQGQSRGAQVGQKVILPASFIGGPRDMKRRYVDAMALVQKFGRPDIFITMTCNPAWSEIKETMLRTDEAHNRPDLLSRVFHGKVNILKEDLFKKHIFGEVAAYTYVVEFQKRGLPHIHMLIILQPKSKLYSTDSYDRIVAAEIPDEHENKYLFNMVQKHMMHGPCGTKNPKNICMQGSFMRRCRNSYPKKWASRTTHGNNTYPTYRRRDDGKKIIVRGQELDNRWVVPYNPYLLAKFNCHINVEICSTVKAVKYIYKYIYKGHDKIHFQVNNDSEPTTNNQQTQIDEITEYQSARWVCPVEAIWRIYRFSLSEMYPAVIHLQLHLENFQCITFNENEDLRDLLQNSFRKRTMLTEFFHMNATDPLAKHLKCTYKEFSEYFVWYPGKKYWAVRQQKDSIGRIVSASPTEGERYFLRLLLTHVKAPTSFDDLKTINGVHVATYR
ncbi:uncharacterized protein [Coffea arabica]|uniref:Helitron helicase-like domain-containing protein n=1 Tax=Coffea arabica TaxID=13443 RepID=A0A6P6VHX2_COFAR|nr:uncharacterized protein LOC113723886 [Coffea arabica]